MSRTNFDQLLEAGCHFGHLKRKWNPAMAPFIFMERNGIHIIDLHKTVVKIDEAADALKQIAKSGKKILFVATKKQAKDVIAEKAANINMPYVIERWPGGMLTNFPTIRKAVKKMSSIDKMKRRYLQQSVKARDSANQPSARQTREKPWFNCRPYPSAERRIRGGCDERAHRCERGQPSGHSRVRYC